MNEANCEAGQNVEIGSVVRSRKEDNSICRKIYGPLGLGVDILDLSVLGTLGVGLFSGVYQSSLDQYPTQRVANEDNWTFECRCALVLFLKESTEPST